MRWKFRKLLKGTFLQPLNCVVAWKYIINNLDKTKTERSTQIDVMGGHMFNIYKPEAFNM